MLVDIIYSAIVKMDGAKFEDLLACPHCGGEVRGYDSKSKHFACILDAGTPKDIYVHVKRFQCRQCGKVSSAHEPFYPDTRLGKPIIDLCITLSANMPYNRTARVLEQMGIVIDRGTVRNYANRDFGPIPCTEIYGFRIPLSVITLSVSPPRRE